LFDGVGGRAVCPISLVELVACPLAVWKIRYETTTLPADVAGGADSRAFANIGT
jgi:hypothetical protein